MIAQRQIHLYPEEFTEDPFIKSSELEIRLLNPLLGQKAHILDGRKDSSADSMAIHSLEWRTLAITANKLR